MLQVQHLLLMEDGLHGDNMVFITAEIGINHNGEFQNCQKT